MSQELLYVIGTAFTWLGWASIALAFYRLVLSSVQPAGLSRAGISRGAAVAAATGAILLLVAATLPLSSDVKATGIKFPVVWVVMPFAAWASLACALVVLNRAYSLALSRGFSGSAQTEAQDKEARAWARQLVVALLGATLFYWLFKGSGDKVEVFRGAIGMAKMTVVWLIVLAVATLSLMAIWGRQAKTRGLAKTFASHIALIIGSVVFGLPFAWLVITSFKEDRDMSSAEGLVWIPKVSVTVPFRKADDPLYEGTYKGQTVQARVIEKLPNGNIRLDISKPMVLRGATYEAPLRELKQVDEQIPVVTGKYKGQEVTGKVIKDLEDGSKRVEITQPAALAGTVFEGPPAEFEPVRHIGLRYQNYPDALEYLPTEAHMGLTYLKNTLIIVILSVIGTLISCSIVAYGFARLQFPAKKLLFAVLLSTMMLPAAVTLLPTFLIFKNLGWIDTLYPLWVPAFFAGAFNVFLLRQFFMTIPKELEDASKIDGCSYFGTFWRVMMPQIKPALAVIAIWTFMGVWNNFMGPLVYINSPENMPIAYAVQLFQGQRSGEPGLLMAFATLAMLPVLALFFFAQRYFIEGVTLSGLGGR